MIKEVISNKNTVSATGFTKDQEKAYEELIKFIDNNYNQNDYKRALIGAAGTGKTFLLSAVINNCRMSYSKIGIAAPTHKACRVIKESLNIPNISVNTLASDLGMRLDVDISNFDINSPNFAFKGNIKINNYSLYIIDESSMLKRDLLIKIEEICTKNKCKLIYVGDESQLPPNNEKYSTAFRNIKAHKLSQIVRQGENNPISKLLDILRDDIRNKTYNFLEYIIKNLYEFNSDGTKGYQVCSTNQFMDRVKMEFSNEEYTNNIDLVKLVSYKNNSVNNWNNFIRNNIIADADKSIITKNDLITSYITIVNDFNECIITNSEEYIIKDVINYVNPTYNLKGFMIRFTCVNGGYDTQPLFIVDHSNRENLVKYVNIADSLVYNAKNASKYTRAERWKEYYKFKNNCLILVNIGDSSGNTKYRRDIDYGFALTAHKSQGSTYNTVLVDVNDIVYDKFGNPYADCDGINRRLYVACSRAKDKLIMRYGV